MKYIKRYEQFTNDELSKESFKSWLVASGLGLATMFGPSKATATDSGVDTAIMTPEIDPKMDTDVKVSKISTATELKITNLLKKDVQENLDWWRKIAKQRARNGMSPVAFKTLNLVINVDNLIDRIGSKFEKSLTNQIPIVVKAIKNGDTKKSCIAYSETLQSDFKKIINEEVESLNWAQKTAIRTVSKIIPENEFCVGWSLRKQGTSYFIAILNFNDGFHEDVQFWRYESATGRTYTGDAETQAIASKKEIDQSFINNFDEWQMNMLNYLDANETKIMKDIVNYAGKIIYGDDYTFQGKIVDGEVVPTNQFLKLKK